MSDWCCRGVVMLTAVYLDRYIHIYSCSGSAQLQNTTCKYNICALSSLSFSLPPPPPPPPRYIHRQAAPYPSVPIPLFRSLALLLDQGYLEVEKGWLMSAESNVNLEQLPHWMGQITLKGVVTDRVRAQCCTHNFDDQYLMLCTRGR